MRKRLDTVVFEKGLVQSRQRARSLVMAGKVMVNGELVDKAGYQVKEDDLITLKGGDIPYVSRGGLKLEAALESFALDVNGLACLDVGVSTGGFTDCLLQNGAYHVNAVDVGYGQIAWKLRNDSRVTVIERMNIRHMPPGTLSGPVDLVTIDVSFISLTVVVPAVLGFMKKEAKILALIKPQFEVGKGKVGKGGVVRDPALHEEVIGSLRIFFSGIGLGVKSLMPSPVLGPKGNKEFLVLLEYSG